MFTFANGGWLDATSIHLTDKHSPTDYPESICVKNKIGDVPWAHFNDLSAQHLNSQSKENNNQTRLDPPLPKKASKTQVTEESKTHPHFWEKLLE